MKNNMKSNPAKTVLTISVGFILVFVITKLHWALLVALFVGLAGILSEYLSTMIQRLK